MSHIPELQEVKSYIIRDQSRILNEPFIIGDKKHKDDFHIFIIVVYNFTHTHVIILCCIMITKIIK